MSDLSPLINDPLQMLFSEIEKMQRGKSQNREKPHKLVLLLAVLNLFERGAIRDNKIYFDEILVQEFRNVFSLVSKDDDWCQPAPPFFHLRTSSFWKHKVIEGREANYSRLKTSGGGYGRIIENIEYAFLSDYAFNIFLQPNSRKLLREFLHSKINPGYSFKGSPSARISEKRAKLINPKKSEDPVIQRIGTMFHETFGLNREAIRQVLNSLNSNTKTPLGDSITTILEKTTNLGNNYIKSMPNYAKGCGLLDQDFHLTEFGVKVLEIDSQQLLSSTQWLMHYHLSAPNGPGPLFWNKLVMKYFQYDSRFSDDELVSYIKSSVESKKGGGISDDSCKSTKTIFIGTYLKSEGLGNLNLLQKDQETGEFLVNYPEPPSIWVMSVALLHYCKTAFPGQRMVAMKDLMGESDFGRIFMTGTRRINKTLEALREIGYVELFTTAPPYAVAILTKRCSTAFREDVHTI